jgi:hypothetical protein
MIGAGWVATSRATIAAWTAVRNSCDRYLQSLIGKSCLIAMLAGSQFGGRVANAPIAVLGVSCSDDRNVSFMLSSHARRRSAA